MVNPDKTPQQLGHEFQDYVQGILEGFHNKYRTITQRLYDTKSAGAFLPSQPGDFFTVWEGIPYMVEAKCSVKHNSLAASRAALTSLVDGKQGAKMRVWHRAGCKGLYIVKSMETGCIEVWDGNQVAIALATPRGKIPEEALHFKITQKDFPEAIKGFFQVGGIKL
jgi:hypothetical protein